MPTAPVTFTATRVRRSPKITIEAPHGEPAIFAAERHKATFEAETGKLIHAEPAGTVQCRLSKLNEAVPVALSSGVTVTFADFIEAAHAFAELVEKDRLCPRFPFPIAGFVLHKDQSVSVGINVHAQEELTAMTADGLPDGLRATREYYGEWQIVGTPTQTGVFKVKVTATNEFGSATTEFTITVK